MSIQVHFQLRSGDRQRQQQMLITQTLNKGQDRRRCKSAVVLHIQQNHTAACKQYSVLVVL